MADMTQQVVYWGTIGLPIADKLPGYADFYQVGQDVTLEDVLSPDYRNALFLLDTDASVWGDASLFAQLPANAVLYDQQSVISADIQRLIDLKNAQAIDLHDLDRLAHVIHYDYFPGQWAFKLAYDTLRVTPAFTGDIVENAQASTTLKGSFGQEWTPIATWTQLTWSYGDWYETFYPECIADVDVRFMVRVVEIQSGRLIGSYTLPAANAKAGLPFYVGKASANIMVSMQARGTGSVTLGRMHINRSREKYGHLFVGGRLLSETNELAQGVATYFDAGDMKPPLIVYFSGFKLGETFEGNFLMRSFHAPFLLITDNRLSGGAFYFGSEILEQQITAVIRKTMQRLGFNNRELVFTGQSMGTTGALYYGAQFLPKAVVIGKPLPEVGTIARYGRLGRPNDFEEVDDMLTFLQGSNDEQAMTAQNDYFWQRFSHADWGKTILGIAYMRQDDFQPDGFSTIYQEFSKQNSHVQLLHKGISGRHNDNSPAITRWFVQIVKFVLQKYYKREETDEWH